MLIEGAGLTIWHAACAGLYGVALIALTCVGSCTALKLPAGFVATIWNTDLIIISDVSIHAFTLIRGCAILVLATFLLTNRFTIFVILMQTMIVLKTITRLSRSQAHGVLATFWSA